MRDDTYSSPAIEERWLQSQRVAEQLRAQAEFSRVLITSSRTLVERGAALSQHAGVAANTEEDEREARARQRLLEWEAEDLSAVVPHELETTRRQFAISLYEMVALGSSLGMSRERLLFHLEYALDRYLQGE